MLANFLKKIQNNPEQIEFKEVIEVIDNVYTYKPCQFSNGPENDKVTSLAGENEGSCKIFAFALMNNLNEQQTLSCFGQYYREDVLQHPNKDNHKNIRIFMKYGWKNIYFEAEPLSKVQSDKNH